MLQNIFYIAVIVLAIIVIVFLVVTIIIVIKTFLAVKHMVESVQTKANEINSKVSSVAEMGEDLLRLATKEGQRAIGTSTILSLLMNSYFFFRTIFKKR